MYRQWKQITLALNVLCALSCGTPTGLNVQKTVHASASLNSNAPVSFDQGGNVGVNMAGFHASAGLGGLLDGDASKGGLHAEAGTPFGQEAGAGIQGVADANAQASSGFAISAHKEAAYGQKTFRHEAEVISEKTVTEAAKVVDERTYQESPQVHRTVIEKTVIPQYVEKTIQVPSYVEKTIRVPTVVEHKVRVPVTPKVVEKTYEEAGAGGHQTHQVDTSAAAGGSGYGGFRKHFHFRVNAHSHGGHGGGSTHIKEKVKIVEKPQVDYSNQGGYNYDYYGNKQYGGSSAGTASISASGYKSGSILGHALSIPVATLGAVGNFLGTLGGGAQFSVNKQYSAHHY